MKYLYLDVNRKTFESKTGLTVSPYGFSMQNAQSLVESLTITSYTYFDIAEFDKLQYTSTSLVAGDKVFIMPGVTIPRYKIRETGKEIGFDIVRSMSKATKIVYDKKQVMDEMVDKSSKMGINVNSLKNILNNYNITLPELDDTEIYENIDIDWTLYRMLRNLDANLDTNHYYTYSYKDSSYKELIDDLIASNKILISDKDVIKQCNGSQPLTRESYNRLVTMFGSSQNQEVALEFLCNCDYEQSMLYILKLVSKFNFNGMRGTNHVNYKSFRTYMKTHWDIDPSYYGGDIMSIINKLADKGKLKREYLNELKDEILDHVKRYGENQIFTISAIQMNETYKQRIVE
jgi:uncharacterized protein YkuJ